MNQENWNSRSGMNKKKTATKKWQSRSGKRRKGRQKKRWKYEIDKLEDKLVKKS